ncbi:MAG: hypothetical protein COT28_03515 [Methylobacterium sp. CG08_land_8_20_14_0_20_71_15]|nr:MAG: hypothetical protein COT56_02265 [Methylobacterium sp. CG09_land_8_20_14_0_10_71_15]PIU15677.1 MAG: hypothetical protein COT28_03515 [Methylobacterium sp. CG08_land_8_20_14_0_20_71_15]GBU17265.1 hypothetical protein AwMethylo_14800 [Methylobacterium sp.]
MSRPPYIPDVGDVPASKVAARMGFASARDFAAALPGLVARGFPMPDPTTGHYCIEAVDSWRRRRHPDLFPELTASGAVSDAGLMRQRLAERRRGGQREDPVLHRP